MAQYSLISYANGPRNGARHTAEYISHSSYPATYSNSEKAHFGIFKTLLAKGEGFLQVKHEPTERKLTVLVDESKVTTHGKPALGTLLMKLHIYRCTADIQACREFYTQLTTPEGIFLDWRQTVLANKPANEIFVQANTSLKDNQVVLKEYDATFEGLVQSWAERAV